MSVAIVENRCFAEPLVVNTAGTPVITSHLEGEYIKQGNIAGVSPVTLSMTPPTVSSHDDYFSSWSENPIGLVLRGFLTPLVGILRVLPVLVGGLFGSVFDWFGSPISSKAAPLYNVLGIQQG